MIRLSALALVPTIAACAGVGGAPAPGPEPMEGPGEGMAHAAVATITAADMAREIGVLAHDSMAGRDTPSPELEAAAAYLAERFRSMGLQPAGDAGTYIHRYEWEISRLDDDSTLVAFEDGDAALEYGVDYFMVPGTQHVSAEAVYVGVAGEDRPTADQRGQLVVMDQPGAELNQEWQQALMAAVQPTMMTGAAGLVLILDPEFSADAISQIAGGTAAQQAPFPWIGLSNDAAERLLASAGRDLDSVRAAEAPVSLGDSPLQVRWARTSRTETPPNVVAMLEGSDPELKDTYIVLTAHFDHVGVGAPDETGDSIYNGADDDASGTAAVLEIAEAFASMPEAPARSVIFLAVSGEEKGLLGSLAWVDEPPVIDIENVVANVNFDMIGRNAPDTVIGIGQEYSTLEATLAEIEAHHPELGLTVILDPEPEENSFFRSDQLAFVREGIPAVYFHAGEHEDYHEASDEPSTIDNDKAARIARMAFLLTYHIAQDPAAPEWTEEGEQQVRQMLRGSPF